MRDTTQVGVRVTFVCLRVIYSLSKRFIRISLMDYLTFAQISVRSILYLMSVVKNNLSEQPILHCATELLVRLAWWEPVALRLEEEEQTITAGRTVVL